MTETLILEELSKAEASSGLRRWQAVAHAVAVRSGFWEGSETTSDKDVVVKLALLITEVAEAVEAVRKGDDANLREELADTALRLFDLAEALSVDLTVAMGEKTRRNLERAYKHGKAF